MPAPPANSPAETAYLAAADLAQARRYDEAVVGFERVLALDPDLHSARFQLGLLLLTMAQPDRAVATWGPLDRLAETDPLRLFKRGLEALIRDEFPDCIRLLTLGIEQNTTNPALSRDMQMVIDRIKETVTSPTSAPPGPAPVRTDFSLYGNSSNDPD